MKFLYLPKSDLLAMIETNNVENVSCDSEPIILVDEKNIPIGVMPKLDCHLNSGHLHRAFSIFIFNQQGEVLLQKRSQKKLLWPGFWSNACCSHPKEGESDDQAVIRRLSQELGFKTKLQHLYDFTYKAKYLNIGVEHEYCSVWLGSSEAINIKANINEISEWRFFKPSELDKNLMTKSMPFTPWMILEWEKLKTDFPNLFQNTK